MCQQFCSFTCGAGSADPSVREGPNPRNTGHGRQHANERQSSNAGRAIIHQGHSNRSGVTAGNAVASRSQPPPQQIPAQEAGPETSAKGRHSRDVSHSKQSASAAQSKSARLQNGSAAVQSSRTSSTFRAGTHHLTPLQQSFIRWAAVHHPALGGQNASALKEAVWQLAAQDPAGYTALLRSAAAELRPVDEPLPLPYSLLLPPRLKNELVKEAAAAAAVRRGPQELQRQDHEQQQQQQQGKGQQQQQQRNEHHQRQQDSYGGLPHGNQGPGPDSTHQADLLWGPEEQALAERKQQEAEDVREGRFLPGSIEDMLLQQARREGTLFLPRLAVNGDTAQNPTLPLLTRMPKQVLEQGVRRMVPPRLRPASNSLADLWSMRSTAHVVWVLTQDDITAWLSWVRTSTSKDAAPPAQLQAALNRLYGLASESPLDVCGPLDPQHHQLRHQRGSGSSRGDRGGVQGRGHAIRGGRPRDQELTSREAPAAALQAGVQALWSTLSFHYARSALEIHVFAEEGVLNMELGRAVMRMGTSTQEMGLHLKAFMARRQRLILRRLRDRRLLARIQDAKEQRHSNNGYLRVTAAARSASDTTSARAGGSWRPHGNGAVAPAVRAAQEEDALDAWGELLSPLVPPDYPPVLRSIPERDIVEVLETGQLPPRYARSSSRGRSRPGRGARLTPSSRIGKSGREDWEADGDDSAAFEAAAAAVELGVRGLENRVKEALRELRAAIASPYVSAPGQVTLVPTVTLRQLLTSMGLTVHSVPTATSANPTAGTVKAAGASTAAAAAGPQQSRPEPLPAAAAAARRHLQQHVKLAQQRQAAQARDLRQVALQSATADGSKPMLVEHLSQEVVVLVASDQSVLKTVAPALKSSSDTEVNTLLVTGSFPQSNASQREVRSGPLAGTGAQSQGMAVGKDVTRGRLAPGQGMARSLMLAVGAVPADLTLSLPGMLSGSYLPLAPKVSSETPSSL